MYPLAKIMALFWTLAEGAIFLYMRWGYCRLKGSDSSQRVWVVLCTAGFFLLALWLLAGETLARDLLSDPRHLKLYRWGTWNFFCTLWVGLEGTIMVYVIRIYRLLPSGSGGFAGTRVSTVLWPLFFLFALYQFALIETALKHGMQVLEIYHASAFYVRICGLLWIAFEWVVAVYGLKTYALLRQGARSGDVTH